MRVGRGGGGAAVGRRRRRRRGGAERRRRRRRHGGRPRTSAFSRYHINLEGDKSGAAVTNLQLERGTSASVSSEGAKRKEDSRGTCFPIRGRGQRNPDLSQSVRQSASRSAGGKTCEMRRGPCTILVLLPQPMAIAVMSTRPLESRDSVDAQNETIFVFADCARSPLARLRNALARWRS